MAFDIDAHQWFSCPACSALFTEERMKAKYAERCRERDDSLASFENPEERQREVRRLGKVPSCPCCTSGKAKFQIQEVTSIGAKDRRGLMRRARFLEMKEWVTKKLAPVFS